jgi:hypothetical protein
MFCCLAAALPLLVMALIFNYALVFTDRYLFWTSQEILGYIIQAEFLAAASGILIICPLLIPVKNKFLKLFLLLIFIGLSSAFAWTAYNIDGIAGMFFYAILVFISYGGGTLFIFDWYYGTSRTFLSLLRWSMAIFVYFTLQLNYDLNSDISAWKDTRAVIPFGATFFYILLALELILYPPLTYYLENKLSQEGILSKKIDLTQKQQENFFKIFSKK